MAKFVKRLLPTPEVRGSNPFNGKLYITFLLTTVLKGRKEKRGRDRPNFKKELSIGKPWQSNF